MQGPDYKKKYLELRAKYMGDIDVAFRLGFEAGGQQAQQQQALEAEAQANEQQHQMDLAEAGGMSNGAPGAEGAPGQGPEAGGPPDSSPEGAPKPPGAEQKNPADMQHEQNGSELDHHIGKLESMLGKNNDPEIQKSLNALISIRKSEKQLQDMKKSQEAINGIAKALHKPAFKIGVQASQSLNDNAKKAVTMQHKIVNDVMKKWEQEESKAKNSIESILSIEGLLKE